MDTTQRPVGAVAAPNRFVDMNGRTLAYRSIGHGKPIVLCTRFRGNLDLWDPAFLDGLASNGFRVVTFDDGGLGLSTGPRTYNPVDLARDGCDPQDALDLRDVVIGGWSLGGLAAQVALAMHPQRLSHVVLIGTSPPGPLLKAAEQLLYDVATRPTNSVEDEVTLFFEPRSQANREAARRSAERIAQRARERSEVVPWEWATANLGDHDIIFPVEDGYALSGRLPTLQLLTYPRSGHGPHHQYPVETARHIAAFVGVGS